MSGAADAYEKLRDRLATLKAPILTRDGKERISFDELTALLDEVLGQAKQIEALARQPANSIDHAMQQALALHVRAGAAAVEAQHIEAMLARVRAGCAAMAGEAKAALLQAITATGAPAVEIETHRATPTEGKYSVVITDENALPVDVMKPATVPDVELIGSRLHVGQKVPGAERKKGDPGIRITPRKSKG